MKIDSFDVDGSFSVAPIEIPDEFRDFDAELQKLGFEAFETYGDVNLIHIQLWKSLDTGRWIACWSSVFHWHNFFFPSTGAMLEFMRRYSQALIGIPIMHGFMEEILEIKALLTDRGGPLYDAQQEKWRQDRADAAARKKAREEKKQNSA